MTRRYLIACAWGDSAEADTHEGALLARATMAAEHRPHNPTNVDGVTITIVAPLFPPDGPTTAAEYRAEAEGADEPLRSWLLDHADTLDRRA